MATYVAFLRAINLSTRRRVSMARLVEVVQAAGLSGAATHLATGNLRVDSARRSTGAVERDLEQLLEAELGFEVPTIVLTPAELRGIVQQVDRVVPPVRRTYVTLLKQQPPDDVAAEVDAWAAPGEGARVAHRSVLWWADHDLRDGTLGNAVLEKRLGVATTRSTGVVRAVADKWA